MKAAPGQIRFSTMHRPENSISCDELSFADGFITLLRRSRRWLRPDSERPNCFPSQMRLPWILNICFVVAGTRQSRLRTSRLAFRILFFLPLEIPSLRVNYFEKKVHFCGLFQFSNCSLFSSLLIRNNKSGRRMVKERWKDSEIPTD